MQENFSPETNQLIAESRLAAIDLGYDYISTRHFFLADCKLNNQYSLRGFSFRNEDEFNSFYNSCRVGDSSIFIDTLPITLEAEHTLTGADSLWRKKYRNKYIQPFHVFLAACQAKNSEFRKLLALQEGLFERLENYYVESGAIDKDSIRK